MTDSRDRHGNAVETSGAFIDDIGTVETPEEGAADLEDVSAANLGPEKRGTYNCGFT